METRELIRPGQPWPDAAGTPINAHGGGFLWHAGRCYWFGEHKIAGTSGNRAHVGVRVYASEDLSTWRNLGVALAVSPDTGHDLAAGCVLERPKVIFNPLTGNFVMWFHLELLGAGYGSARSGVAVADCPEGPYRYLGSLRPNAGVWPENLADGDRRELNAEELRLVKEPLPNGDPGPEASAETVHRRDHAGGQMARDMTLFVDDDGRAYHVYASEENRSLHISLLSDDFLRPAGRYIRVFPGRYHEAPALMKHAGHYFLFSSDCTGWEPNPARLSVAPSLWGPWEELGNPCQGTPAEVATTFGAQSTAVLTLPGSPDRRHIFCADRWCPHNAIDGRYVWLPVRFEAGRPVLRWCDVWTPTTWL